MLDPRSDDGREDAPVLAAYARAIRAHWKVALAVLVLCLASAAFAVTRIEPQYEAKAELLVTPAPLYDAGLVGLDLIRDSGDEVRTMQTAASVVHSPRTARRASKALGPRLTEQEVLDRVDVEVEGQSNVLVVTDRSASPAEAADTANAFAKAAVTERRDQMVQDIDDILRKLAARREALVAGEDRAGAEALADRIATLEDIRASGRDPTLSLTSLASTPVEATGLPRAFVIFVALLLGLGLASGAALALDALSTRVRDEAELESVFPIPVLMRIPQIRWSGGHLMATALPTAAVDAFDTLAAQVEWRASQAELPWAGDGALTLCVTSANTGDGNTTATASLAAAFARAGYSVVVIDCDLRRPGLHAAFGLEPRDAVAALLRSNDPLEDHLVAVPELPGVEVLTAHAADPAMVSALALRSSSLVAQARERANIVLLDAPPIGEFGDAVRMREGIDHYLLVVRPRHTRRASAEAARELLDSVGLLPIGMVVNATPSWRLAGARRSPQSDPTASWKLPDAWTRPSSR